jgi:hypothetical protein
VVGAACWSTGSSRRPAAWGRFAYTSSLCPALLSCSASAGLWLSPCSADLGCTTPGYACFVTAAAAPAAVLVAGCAVWSSRPGGQLLLPAAAVAAAHACWDGGPAALVLRLAALSGWLLHWLSSSAAVAASPLRHTRRMSSWDMTCYWCGAQTDAMDEGCQAGAPLDLLVLLVLAAQHCQPEYEAALADTRSSTINKG